MYISRASQEIVHNSNYIPTLNTTIDLTNLVIRSNNNKNNNKCLPWNILHILANQGNLYRNWGTKIESIQMTYCFLWGWYTYVFTCIIPFEGMRSLILWSYDLAHMDKEWPGTISPHKDHKWLVALTMSRRFSKQAVETSAPPWSLQASSPLPLGC